MCIIGKIKAIKFFKKVYHFIKQENLFRVLMILVVMIILSTFTLALVEKKTIVDACWLSIVTLTTVGYGDITPVTPIGRLIGVFIMIFGIGILGMFTASIASIFVEKKLKEERGMRAYEFENHIIICTWNHRAKAIIEELRLDKRLGEAPIILIAEIDIKPVDDDNLYFIKGNISEENLNKANLSKASTVIILGDDNVDPAARDAKVVLSALTVESINPHVYTIVEIVSESNIQHCERAKADEIIVGEEFSSKLISRAALDHGVSGVLSELLTSRKGNEIYIIPIPQEFISKNFIDIFTQMKQERNCIVLAIKNNKSGEIKSNPPADYLLQENDDLIIISAEKPE